MYENGMFLLRDFKVFIILSIFSFLVIPLALLALASYRRQRTGSLFLCWRPVVALAKVNFIKGCGVILSPLGLCHFCGLLVQDFPAGICFICVEDQ